MERVAFKMKLYDGCAVEYKKRHTEIWPDLVLLLKEAGVSEYLIFLDEETNILFASLKVPAQDSLIGLPSYTVMQKWWAYMGDITESNPDNSPVSRPLEEVFYLP
jgi:L-rhamnose mutarotase